MRSDYWDVVMMGGNGEADSDVFAEQSPLRPVYDALNEQYRVMPISSPDTWATPLDAAEERLHRYFTGFGDVVVVGWSIGGLAPLQAYGNGGGFQEGNGYSIEGVVAIEPPCGVHGPRGGEWRIPDREEDDRVHLIGSDTSVRYGEVGWGDIPRYDTEIEGADHYSWPEEELAGTVVEVVDEFLEPFQD